MFLFQSEMPFTDGVGVVAGIAQKFREWNDALGQTILVSGDGNTGQSVTTLTRYTGDMIIVAAKEHGARRFAKGRGMKLGKENSFPGQRIDVGRVDVSAINAEVGITKIIRDDQKNIRSPRFSGGVSRLAANESKRDDNERSKNHKQTSFCLGNSTVFSLSSEVFPGRAGLQ